MKSAVYLSAVMACVVTAGSSFAAQHAAMPVPAYIHDAVDDSGRPAADRARDVNREPAQVLTFAGIKPGQQIGELMPFGGYYTRLLCRVVGSTGHVYAIDFKLNMPPKPAGAPAHPMPAPPPLGCDNVTKSDVPASELMLPGNLDVVWTTEDYHDMHTPLVGSPDMHQLDKVIFDALKPGGVFLVEDHVAAAGTGASVSSTLHRIDPELVKEEVESVGFQLVGQSNVLHNPADDHTQRVFTMVDKTDRFIFKFRKPAS